VFRAHQSWRRHAHARNGRGPSLEPFGAVSGRSECIGRWAMEGRGWGDSLIAGARDVVFRPSFSPHIASRGFSGVAPCAAPTVSIPATSPCRIHPVSSPPHLYVCSTTITSSNTGWRFQCTRCHWRSSNGFHRRLYPGSVKILELFSEAKSCRRHHHETTNRGSSRETKHI
jgi:hypothetical protein